MHHPPLHAPGPPYPAHAGSALRPPYAMSGAAEQVQRPHRSALMCAGIAPIYAGAAPAYAGAAFVFGAIAPIFAGAAPIYAGAPVYAGFAFVFGGTAPIDAGIVMEGGTRDHTLTPRDQFPISDPT
eukprot:902805-Rhodomonas_salina.2